MSNVPERGQKNEHQYAKILLFSLVAEEDWEEDIGVWRHRAVPVYRKPQDEWGVAADHSQRWIYFLPMTVGEGDADPNSISFPEWIQCFWDSQAGKWIVFQSASGDGRIRGTLTALADGTGDYTGKKVGTVSVVTSSCDSIDLLGASVEVVDWSGCIFDHEFEDLDGVWVWASKVVGLSLDPEAEEGALTPCHFGADDRCCVAADTGA